MDVCAVWFSRSRYADVTVHGDRLTIKGECKAERAEHETGRVYREVRYGRFERTVRLPDPIDLDSVSHDNVLRLEGRLSLHEYESLTPVYTEYNVRSYLCRSTFTNAEALEDVFLPPISCGTSRGTSSRTSRKRSSFPWRPEARAPR